VAVAIFFTGDLGRGNFFQQRGCTADDFLRREGQAGDAGLQVFDVAVQLVSQRRQAFGALLENSEYSRRWKPVKSSAFTPFFVVVDARVDGRIKVTEQLGNRLDRLVVNAGRRVELLRGGQIAFLHRIGELLGVAASSSSCSVT
jgi:hypothetical protein